MSTITTLQDSLIQIAKKSGKTEAEIKEAYDKALTTLPPSIKSEPRKQKFALIIVNRDFAVNTRSTAQAYEGIIIGARKTKDVMENVITNGLKAYQDNPEGAISSGLVKLDGEQIIILDNRTEVNGQPNKKLGQPRPKTMFLRELIIAARKPGESDYTIGTMQLWNEQAKIVLPVLKELSFKANGELTDGEYDLRSSVDTMFEVRPDSSEDEVIRVLDDSFQKNLLSLGELFAFHAKIKNLPEYWDSFVVTEGSVTWIQEFTNSIKIVLNDDSIAGDPLHSDGITCWVPKNLSNLVNFGRGSIVTVIARTGDGKFYDRKAKVQTDDDIVQLNVFGIMGRPGLTTAITDDGDAI